MANKIEKTYYLQVLVDQMCTHLLKITTAILSDSSGVHCTYTHIGVYQF